MRSYQTILNSQQLNQLRSRLDAADRVAVDTETTGLDTKAPDFLLVGISVAPTESEGYYLPLHHYNYGGLQYQPGNLDYQEVTEFMRWVFASKEVVMHNQSYDRLVFANAMNLPMDLTKSHDTKLVYHLIDENGSLSLKELAKRFLKQGDGKLLYKDVAASCTSFWREQLVQTSKVAAISAKTGRSYKKNAYHLPDDWLDQVEAFYRKLSKGTAGFKFLQDYWAAFCGVLKLRGLAEYEGAFPTSFMYTPVRLAASYAADDAMNTMGLWVRGATSLELEGLYDLYMNIERETDDVMTRVEYEGILLDRPVLEDAKTLLSQRFMEATDEAFEKLGHIVDATGFVDGRLNADTILNSAPQLRTVLFDMAGFPVIERTETNQPSTNRTSLEKLLKETPAKMPSKKAEAHEFIRAKLKMEAIKKLLSTYTDSIIEKMDEAGRIHPSFNVTGTVSGRMSSTSPNFQNMPRLLPDELKAKPWLHGVDIRKALVADPGCVFVDFDYMAMEMVVCAALSGDANMRDVLNQGRDLHSYTARYAFNVGHDLSDDDFKKTYKDYRQKAKVVNFALIYGGSEWTLVKNFGFTESEATQLIQGYFAAYPGVATWMKDVYETLETHKQVVYPEFGYVKRLDMPDKNLPYKEFNRRYRGALRSSQNALIQGYSAFIVKKAIVDISRELRARGLQSRVAFQVHDEIGCLSPFHEAREVYDIMTDKMVRTINGVFLGVEGEYKLTMSKSDKSLTLEEVEQLAAGGRSVLRS